MCLFKGRQEAFDIFRRDYKNNSAIEQNKSELKTKMKEAKQIGGLVNKSREKISEYLYIRVGWMLFSENKTARCGSHDMLVL